MPEPAALSKNGRQRDWIGGEFSMSDETVTFSPVTRAEFARSLAESGLLDAGDVPPDPGPRAGGSGVEAAAELVAAGKLTAYQADAVLARRFADLRIDGYEILDRLGAGGMGTVYKARHRRMKRVVAVKVLSREVATAGTFANRFQREVETIARLTHPNIVMAFDAGESESGPYLVMEFVNGRDLASEVSARGPLPVAEAVDWILQAARGLDYAHNHGIIHRDIKPGNLLRDADGVVKVADLGLARISDSGGGAKTSLTQAGSIFGTVDYMSPEQAVDSGAVDHRADIYSLGCTLFFLLTGQPLYAGGSLMALMLKHRDAAIPSLCGARPDVPPELNAIFVQMVAKRPEDRQATMGNVVRQLEQVRARPTAAGAPHVGRSAAAAVAAPERTVALDSPLAAGFQDTGSFEVGPSVADTEARRLAGMVAVIAEPSRTQAGIIRTYLRQLGIESAHTARSGREAVETVKRVGAELLISSMHLTDMTGVDLAVAVQADPECRRVRFVLATSETDADTLAALPQNSRTAVMPKPFDLDLLTRAIASVVN
jgi:CheY-like chemotaxis protein